MRQRLMIGCAVLGTAACGSAASTAGSKSKARHCGPSGAHTLVSGRQGRVYERGGGVFGCAFGSGSGHRLGAVSRSLVEPTVGPIAIAGTVVAYGSKTFGTDTATVMVDVRRLTSGRFLHARPALTQPVRPESFQTVSSVVVASDGAVAWIGSAESGPSRNRMDVEALEIDASGERVLDSGAGVDPSSLRLNGSRLTWMDSGASRDAELR
jgi:hypothetical protein